MKRRQFLGLMAAVAALPSIAWARRPLKILILGGTGFIGPHQVETALGRGHEITIFNRGKTAPDMFPQVENLLGDRDNDLKALQGRKWDAVIDNSGHVPRWVKQSCELLKGNIGQYLYMSTISVYADNSVIGQTESGAVQKLEDPNSEDRDNANYGGMKALAEEYTREVFPETSTQVRAGLIVGSGDPTDRFTYWPVRVHRGGEVLAPGKPSDPIQCIDVRDLALWTINAIEQKHFGTFNVTGPYHQMTMGEFLKIVRTTTNSEAEFTWVSADFLQEQKVSPWQDLPLWVPPESGLGGFTQVDISRAVSAGLTIRPMSMTVQDALAWHRTMSRPGDGALQAGLSPEREKQLLAAWHAKKR